MSRNHYMKEGVVVHPALTEVYAAAVATKKALDTAMAKHRKAAEILNACVVELVKIPVGHHMIVGSWECPTSPVGFCIYDVDADDGMEDCLYCHEPSERK
jgi:hypothetical protein